MLLWTWKDTNLENNIDKPEIHMYITSNASEIWPHRKVEKLSLSVYLREKS